KTAKRIASSVAVCECSAHRPKANTAPARETAALLPFVTRRTRPRLDALEARDLPSVSSVVVSGSVLTVTADDSATSVLVQSVGPSVQVQDLGTGASWTRSNITEVDFVGGAGNDRFVNTVAALSTKAWGNGGNDYLAGSGGDDTFDGGFG